MKYIRDNHSYPSSSRDLSFAIVTVTAKLGSCSWSYFRCLSNVGDDSMETLLERRREHRRVRILSRKIRESETCEEDPPNRRVPDKVITPRSSGGENTDIVLTPRQRAQRQRRQLERDLRSASESDRTGQSMAMTQLSIAPSIGLSNSQAENEIDVHTAEQHGTNSSFSTSLGIDADNQITVRQQGQVRRHQRVRDRRQVSV
jgi:hypothetical protein